MYYGQKTAYYKGWLIGYAIRAYVSASTCHGGLNKHVTEKSSPNHTHLFISTEDHQEQIYSEGDSSVAPESRTHVGESMNTTLL